MTDPRIIRARAWHCPVPMRHPVRLGAIEYRTRDYAVLCLTDDDGREGWAVGYTRGTQLVGELRTLVSALLGLPTAHPAVVQDTLYARYTPGWAQFVRAASLLDIALWDLHAQRAEEPLHRLLGATEDSAELMVVVGYLADRRSDEELVEEARQMRSAGFRQLKLILGGHDQARDVRLTAGVLEAIGPDAQLGIDFHAPWRTSESAAEYLRPLAELPLRFVEDPFAATQWRSFAELHELTDLPLAAGEDAIGLATYEALLPSLSALRADATASGGITVFLEAARMAAGRKVAVVPHVFPYVHAPLAAALAEVPNAEVVPVEVGADPITELLAEELPLAGGRWHFRHGSGVGLAIDEAAVARLADQHVVEQA